MAKTKLRTYSNNSLLFNASDYLPSNLFDVSSSVPYTSEKDFEQKLEKIKGQIRSVELAQQNLILTRHLYKAEGYAIDVNNEIKKNEIKLEDGRTLDVKLQQAQTTTAIESAKLTELQHDLDGHTRQAGLKQQAWQLKIEGLEHDLDKAKQLLELKKQEVKQLN